MLKNSTSRKRGISRLLNIPGIEALRARIKTVPPASVHPEEKGASPDHQKGIGI